MTKKYKPQGGLPKEEAEDLAGHGMTYPSEFDRSLQKPLKFPPCLDREHILDILETSFGVSRGEN